MSRMLSTQGRDYTKGRAATQLGEAGGRALPTHTHALFPNLLSQELRTNQSKVAAGLHRAHVAYTVVRSLPLDPCLQQGSLPLATDEVCPGLRNKLSSCYTPALYTQANITILEQLTLVISVPPHYYFNLYLFLYSPGSFGS